MDDSADITEDGLKDRGIKDGFISPDGPDQPVENVKDRQFVTALARGLEVLRSFKPRDRHLGNQDIALRTGLPKPTVSRLTYTLTRMGYLYHDEKLGKYQLGTGVLSLGFSLLTNMDVLKIARPLMQDLANYSHTVVSVGTRDRLGMIYLDGRHSTDATVSLRREPGTRVPIATTAMGRALLCGLPVDERERLMNDIRQRDPENWPKHKTGIEQALRDYRERGFCLSIGDWRSDVNAVGVPMLPIAGCRLLTFNCAAPSFVLRQHMLEDDIGPRLVNLVRTIESEAARY
ncbi:IclR family transcriptional regulator [Geopsychrobacter electrodiphilus]|uniref:IclR family transcriptional regulator n=1 Tax=Geopsychrobacter electrodiphilus TaxID=225196 RepID=UPI000374B745|nr:IclR family transcriptional regulator [Geopsychrobacter electrodiphilus]